MSEPERASELEYLRWFCCEADFGPGDGDVRDSMSRRFIADRGKNIPLGWEMLSDGETSSDQAE